MARDRLAITCGVVEQLTRLGVAVPPHDAKLTTAAYSRSGARSRRATRGPASA